MKAEDDAALKALKKRRGSAAKGKGAAADGGGKKVTAFEIAERKVAEAKLQDDEITARKMSAMNITSAAEYAGMLDQNGAGNANHDIAEASASGIDGALEVMVGNTIKVEAMAMIQKETSGEDLGLRAEALAAKGEMTWKPVTKRMLVHLAECARRTLLGHSTPLRPSRNDPRCCMLTHALSIVMTSSLSGCSRRGGCQRLKGKSQDLNPVNIETISKKSGRDLR